MSSLASLTSTTVLSPVMSTLPASFSRHSNSAGSPLPRIPRRSLSNSSRPSSTITVPDTPPSPPKSTVLVVSPPTPPQAPAQTTHRPRKVSPSGSSSSSDSPMQFLVPRQRRGLRMRTPEESTPTPAVHRARSVSPPKQVAFPTHTGPSSPETPRPSSSASGGNRVRPGNGAVATSLPEPPTAAQVEVPNRAMSVCVPSNIQNQLARKKSGEPLKSSLKSRRTVVRGDLSVVTGEAMGVGSSKSEPTTPMHSSKSVHFDSQLEHVKLFLAEQKPLAVSRDGSPTTDTSGTDSDFPAFIYGEDEKLEKKGKVVMEVTNMPAKDAPARKEAECALEELTLGPDGATIQGRVRVKNIAFEKWVAVRFTFDWWQTTSEVTARYAQTLEGGAYDIFAFTIRLNDMLARIEEKTLFMAVRYTVAGREIWDNNDNQNFQVKFSRQIEAPKPATPPTQSESETAKEQTRRKNLSALHLKLEKVASDQSPPRKSPSPRADSFNLRSSTPLSARYDFSASLRRPWKSPSPTAHTRTVTYPSTTSPGTYHSPSYTAHPPFTPRASARTRVAEDPAALTRGSPRILEDDAPAGPIPTVALPSGSDEEDGAGAGATPMPFSRVRGRNHQRGYFDLGPATPGFGRKALPAAFRPDAVPRFNSVDAYRTPASPGMLGPWPLARGGSEESTPSVTSQSEESSANSSPSGSPREENMFGYLARTGGVRSAVNDPSYNVFLNKFCFYTGPDSLLDVQPDAIQRSHSASSVEEFLSSPTSNYHLSPGSTPTRSPSFDDVAYMSGASTPTARAIVGSQPATPISLAS